MKGNGTANHSWIVKNDYLNRIEIFDDRKLAVLNTKDYENAINLNSKFYGADDDMKKISDQISKLVNLNSLSLNLFG